MASGWFTEWLAPRINAKVRVLTPSRALLMKLYWQKHKTVSSGYSDVYAPYVAITTQVLLRLSRSLRRRSLMTDLFRRRWRATTYRLLAFSAMQRVATIACRDCGHGMLHTTICWLIDELRKRETRAPEGGVCFVRQTDVSAGLVFWLPSVKNSADFSGLRGVGSVISERTRAY